MYGKNARQTLIAVLKDSPEMQAGHFPDAQGRERKITDHLLRQMADRILMELWMRGFALSARKLADKSPTGERGDREMHDAWRNSKAKKPKQDNQSDVEDKSRVARSTPWPA